jgi:hypothetical protein
VQQEVGADGVFEKDNVNMGRKDLVGDGIVHLSFGVLLRQLGQDVPWLLADLEEVELDKLARVQRFAGDGIYKSAT